MIIVYAIGTLSIACWLGNQVGWFIFGRKMHIPWRFWPTPFEPTPYNYNWDLDIDFNDPQDPINRTINRTEP